MTRQSKSLWLRWMPLWHSTFFVILAFITLMSYPDWAGTNQQTRILVLLSLLLGWYLFSMRWQRITDDTVAPYGLAYYAIGWLIWFALTYNHMGFMLLLFILYPRLFITFNMLWASVGAVFLTILIVLRQSAQSTQGLETWILLLSIMTISGVILAYFIQAVIRESESRNQLIQRLEAAQKELARAEREAGILEERQRLALEIHDTLAQGLISIITLLEAAENQREQHNLTASQQHLDLARTTARSNLDEARRFTRGLRPELLEQFPFEAAMKEAVKNWRSSTGIAVEITITGTPAALPQPIEEALLRIMQEALTNVKKHARATTVNITLSYLKTSVMLDIQDDGSGFEPTQPHPPEVGGLGLTGMRERILPFHGKLEIESHRGEGTTIAVDIPLGNAL